MTIVITSWRRGSTSHLSGQRICDSTGRMDSWGCSTTGDFADCSWFSSGPAYITEGCYNGLTDGEKAACVSRYAGIVTSSGYYYIYSTYYYNRYKLKIESIVKCWSTACFNLRPDLHCEGVVCDPVCIGSDKYSQVCVTEGENAGECAFDQVIEANSPDCPGYDPCKGVECPDKCYDYDLHETICEDGVCIKGVLIEADNREVCDYDPCRGVDCPDECFGEDKWRMECEEGECIPDRVVEPNSPDCDYTPPDLCVGVVCEDVCDDTTLYEGVCDGGICIRGRLIETSSPVCGYIPDPEPEPEKTQLDTIIIVGVIVVLFYLFVGRK